MPNEGVAQSGRALERKVSGSCLHEGIDEYWRSKTVSVCTSPHLLPAWVQIPPSSSIKTTTKETIMTNFMFFIVMIIGAYLIGSVAGWEVGLGALLIGWAAMPYPE